MFTHFRSKAFILKKKDRGESDRLFTVFSEDFGKLDLMAKALRKIKSKLRSGLDVFYLSEIEFIQGKAQKTLTDAILIDRFPVLRKNLSRLKVAHLIAGVLDKLVKGQEPDKGVWDLLDEVFRELDKDTAKIKSWLLVYYYFLWNLLSLLGYQLDLYSCVSCQKKLSPENIKFSFKEGGFLCKECQGPEEKEDIIFPETIKILRVFLKRDFKTLERIKIEKEELNKINVISGKYLSDILEKTQ